MFNETTAARSARGCAFWHALAHYAADHHEGQWSRLYLLGCYAGQRLARVGILRPIDLPMSPEASTIYAGLADRGAK
ncbi:MAG TPA: hypothetical protein PKE29_15530 [Phycisphaerales bacterium]|nr:hypothetical protein [Phycisphaerales bacterium]